MGSKRTTVTEIVHSESEEPTVLVVDDSTSCLQVIQKALNGLDCRMLVAKSGKRGLDLARSQLPQLVLLDVVMDEMDGFETCRRLKADPLTETCVVLFLSGQVDGVSRLKGLEMGGVDYIAKPFSVEEVRAKVSTHLEMLALRQELEVRNRELKDAIHTQNRMLGMAAHDLRTPLTAIMIAADTLRRRDKLTPEIAGELLDIVESSSRDMKTLINELLTVSSLQSSELKLKKTDVDLNHLVESRLVLHNMAAENKKISIELELNSVPLLRLDANKMAQVVDNLISNALKYSWPESSITLRTELDDDRSHFSVEDKGVGIDPNQHHLVFQPFSKLDITPTAGESSHGLGLSIVANIVKAHGGTVSLKSELGKGSSFKVSLPRTLG
jgi:two-component system, sensor histidine kinase and response regulator